MYGIVLALIFGFLTAEICSNYQPAKLSMLFFSICWVPLLVLHEAGHALVAKLIRLRHDNQSWRIYRHHLLVENK